MMKERNTKRAYRKPPLSEQQITEICRRLNANETMTSLSREYQVGTKILYFHWKNHLKNKI